MGSVVYKKFCSSLLEFAMSGNYNVALFVRQFGTCASSFDDFVGRGVEDAVMKLYGAVQKQPL